MTGLIVLIFFLGAQAVIGFVANRFFRGSPKDFYLASNTIGPFVLFMTIFGTTMTAFALVGSTGESFEKGIGVYGQLASWSGLVHSAVFFLVGIKLWGLGRRYGYVTQVQYFRDRFESSGVGYLLFPILVALVIPYVIMGMISSGALMQVMTAGAFPEAFPTGNPATHGGVPSWIGAACIALVVLYYVFFGGQRGTAWANVFQVIVFMAMAVLAFALIAYALGGPAAATERVTKMRPDRLSRAEHISEFEFLSYCLIPLSVGMFPHLFQQWLTAKSAKTFRLSVIMHPISIMVLWAPCVMIGIWASTLVAPAAAPKPAGAPTAAAVAPAPGGAPTGGPAAATAPGGAPTVTEWPPKEVKPFIRPTLKSKPELAAPDEVDSNKVLGQMIGRLIGPIPFWGGFLAALIAAGIMSAVMSYDSQFLSLGTMFSNDVVLHHWGKDRFTEKQQVLMTRIFIAAIALISYALSVWVMAYDPKRVFNLGVWTFSAFASLFPIVFASIYWKRTTLAGVYASILTTAGVWLFYFARSDWGNNKNPIDFGFDLFGQPVKALPVVVIFAASTAALIVVSLCTKGPSPATIDKFFDPRLMGEGKQA